MQSYSKRMDKGNPVAWRLRHFSWRSRVTSEVIISVFYIHWKKIVRRDWYGNPSKIAQSPEAWGFASHPCSQSDRRRIWTYISDIQVSILITELSSPPPPPPLSYLERLTTYQFSDVLEVNQWGFGLNKPLSLPSSLTERASVYFHLQTS